MISVIVCIIIIDYSVIKTQTANLNKKTFTFPLSHLSLSLSLPLSLSLSLSLSPLSHLSLSLPSRARGDAEVGQQNTERLLPGQLHSGQDQCPPCRLGLCLTGCSDGTLDTIGISTASTINYYCLYVNLLPN